jgi:hypothetical protein
MHAPDQNEQQSDPLADNNNLLINIFRKVLNEQIGTDTFELEERVRLAVQQMHTTTPPGRTLDLSSLITRMSVGQV